MQAITIKGLGHISSLLGSSEVMVACDYPVPVSAILDELRSRYPLFSNYVGQLENIEESVLILADGRDMQLDSLVEPGKQLVLVTPISGG
jgi:molybdopterin converting factor small subunit